MSFENIVADLGFSDDQIAEYYGSVRNKYIKVSKKAKPGKVNFQKKNQESEKSFKNRTSNDFLN